jgi:hypothetical protein
MFDDVCPTHQQFHERGFFGFFVVGKNVKIPFGHYIPPKAQPIQGNDASTMSITKSTKIQPFEWLTSPESIGGFVREHVLESSSSSNSASNNEPPRAMHIGCGSSTVGEYLVRELCFSKVVNVDRDRETMEGMAERWSEMTDNGDDCTNTTTSTATIGKTEDEKTEKEPSRVLFPSSTILLPTEEISSSSSSSSSSLSRNHQQQHHNNPMEFWCLDYTSETLPENYADSFDLVVDKSTLDCTLCSDCSATASFLMEIYRTLKVNGGVYMVISFHELDLILPLLEELPGAQWTVSHTTMDRQVECLVANASGRSSSTASPNNNTSDLTSHGAGSNESSSRKPLNVLIARRRWSVCETNVGSTAGGESSPPPALVFEKVVEHVQTVNDRWFQDEQPLLTETRIEDLRKAFFSPEEPNNNNDQEREGGKSNSNSNSKHLSLEEAYEVVFTDAEREHLTYEHFLEDWEAFCKEEENQEEPDKLGETNVKGIMTYDLALNFLRANQ